MVAVTRAMRRVHISTTKGEDVSARRSDAVKASTRSTRRPPVTNAASVPESSTTNTR